MQERFLEVSAAVEQLSQQKGREPSVIEIAQACRRTTDEVVAALEAGQGYRASSLDAAESEVPSSEATDEPGALSEHDELTRFLALLPKRDREVLMLRFVEELSQAQIAARLDISQMHVSRLLRRSLGALRHAYGVGSD